MRVSKSVERRVDMSSFTQEQVRAFRQIFSQFTDEERGGLPRENFVPAASASLEHCDLRSRPSDVYLAGEFSRLAGESGVVNWQQFFQVSSNVASPQKCYLSLHAALFDVLSSMYRVGSLGVVFIRVVSRGIT